MEGGKEQNYWPGFVDVLSNVVLTLVFVLVVFVMALSLSADKVEKKMQEIIQDKKDLESKNAEIVGMQNKKCPNEVVKSMDNVIVPDQNIVIENIESTKLESAPTEVKITKSANKIIINYPLSGVNLDDKYSVELEAKLGDMKQKIGKYKIVLHSYLGNEQYSVAQRLAYYRALYIRKFLIDKGFADANMISSQILRSEKLDSEKSVGYVEIIFQSN